MVYVVFVNLKWNNLYELGVPEKHNSVESLEAWLMRRVGNGGGGS